jgi:hypothetical protein
VTTLRALLERWTGRIRVRPWPKELKTGADFQAARDHSFDSAYKSAHGQVKFQWELFRMDEGWIRRSGRGIKAPSEETALMRQIIGRKRSDREGAAALLHGRNLSQQATAALVWQLRHRNPSYRQAAMDALWGSTITDADAALVLAGQLDNPDPVERGRPQGAPGNEHQDQTHTCRE